MFKKPNYKTLYNKRLKIFMLSIIVPTLNEEKYIGSCLKSIKKQDVDKEIIVVDSNSEDDTAKIAKKYADKVIVTKKVGVGMARNKGAEKAKGDIYLFIDADMRLNKGVLKRVLKEFEDQDLVGLCGEAYSTGKWRYRIIYQGVFLVTKIFLLFGIPLFPSMFVAYRRKAFKRVNGFKDWISAEDYDISYRMRNFGDFNLMSGGIWTSPRRLKRHYWKYVFFHIKNSLNYLIFNREGSRDYPALR